jgi:hypothetical protein
VVFNGAAEQLPFFGAAQHRGVNEAGRNAVDGYPVGPVFQRKRFGEPVDRRFRRDVVGHERLARVGARRRNVHDAAPAGFDHAGEHGLDGVEHAVEVDVDDTRPRFEGQVREPLESFHACGVDQRGDRAKRVVHRGDRRLHLRAVRDIRDEAVRLVGRREVEDRHLVTVAAQPACDRATDTGRPTGHECGLHGHALTLLSDRPITTRSMS